MRQIKYIWVICIAYLMLTELSMAYLGPLKFTHLTKSDGLSATLMYRMIEDHHGTLWIGSKDGGGLYRYDGYELSAYMSDFNDKQSISNNNITALFEDQKGYIWIGTQGGGLNRFDPQENNFKIYKQDPSNPYSLINNNVQSIIEDHFGNIWVGTRQGLGMLAPDSNTFCNFLIKSGKSFRNNIENSVYCMIQDGIHPEKIWLGTAAGLKCFNLFTQEVITFDNPFTETAIWPDSNDPRQLPVNDMIQDDQGIIWLGTFGAGLIAYNTSTNQWQQFKFEEIENPDELFSYNVIFDLFWDKQDKLWIGSEKRMGFFDMKKKLFHFYEPHEQDSTSMLNTGYYSILIDHNHFLWGGAYLGLSRSIDPIDSTDNQPSLYTQITGLDVLGKPYNVDGNIRYTDTVHLLADQNEIKLSFAAINPAFPGKVEYAYQLQGKESRWKYIQPGNPLSVRYPRLSGNYYTFRVKARMPGQHWGPATQIVVHIRKSFWQSIWFYLLLAIVIVSVGMTIYSYHQQQIKEKQAIKTAYNQRLMEMEMTSLRAQMNPHFMFNSLNSIKHFIIKNDTKDASRYLSKFSQLMRLILQNSQKAMISLVSELRALELYIQLEQLRFKYKFEYRIDIDEAIDKLHTAIPPMILQPYVENAIWHGLLHKEDEGLIKIDIHKQDKSLLIAIEDNGIGRKKAQELKSRSAVKHKSYGMQITSNRLKLVEMLHQLKTDIHLIDLEDQEGNALGTRVEIKIPLITSGIQTKELV